jgi:hypothetical protein
VASTSYYELCTGSSRRHLMDGFVTVISFSGFDHPSRNQPGHSSRSL